jgi:hypothetical protein
MIESGLIKLYDRIHILNIYQFGQKNKLTVWGFPKFVPGTVALP